MVDLRESAVPPAPSAVAAGASWAYAHVIAVGERKGLAFADRTEKLLATGLQEPLHGTPRDPHQLGGLPLLFVFEIAKAHRLELVETELDDVELRERYARRFEQIETVDAAAVAELLPAGHGCASIGRLNAESKIESVLYSSCICT